jgi:hypothetical protein
MTIAPYREFICVGEVVKHQHSDIPQPSHLWGCRMLKRGGVVRLATTERVRPCKACHQQPN